MYTWHVLEGPNAPVAAPVGNAMLTYRNTVSAHATHTVHHHLYTIKIQLSLRMVNTASCVILASELSVAHLVCTVKAAPELNFTHGWLNAATLHPLDRAQVQGPIICVCVTVADMNWGYWLRVWFDTCACCLLMVAGYGL